MCVCIKMKKIYLAFKTGRVGSRGYRPKGRPKALSKGAFQAKATSILEPKRSYWKMMSSLTVGLSTNSSVEGHLGAFVSFDP